MDTAGAALHSGLTNHRTHPLCGPLLHTCQSIDCLSSPLDMFRLDMHEEGLLDIPAWAM